MTSQRRAILEAVRNSRVHPTADEVYAQVRSGLPRISLGTVYRNLEMLAQWGLIRKVEAGGTQKRFDGNTGEHWHVRCLGCGRVEDAAVAGLESVDLRRCQVPGYRVVGCTVEIQGYCPRCVKAGNCGPDLAP